MGTVLHARGRYADLGNVEFPHEPALEVELEAEAALDEAARSERSQQRILHPEDLQLACDLDQAEGFEWVVELLALTEGHQRACSKLFQRLFESRIHFARFVVHDSHDLFLLDDSDECRDCGREIFVPEIASRLFAARGADGRRGWNSQERRDHLFEGLPIDLSPALAELGLADPPESSEKQFVRVALEIRG